MARPGPRETELNGEGFFIPEEETAGADAVEDMSDSQFRELQKALRKIARTKDQQQDADVSVGLKAVGAHTW
jgi:hypothetical protein